MSTVWTVPRALAIVTGQTLHVQAQLWVDGKLVEGAVSDVVTLKSTKEEFAQTFEFTVAAQELQKAQVVLVQMDENNGEFDGNIFNVTVGFDYKPAKFNGKMVIGLAAGYENLDIKLNALGANIQRVKG